MTRTEALNKLQEAGDVNAEAAAKLTESRIARKVDVEAFEVLNNVVAAQQLLGEVLQAFVEQSQKKG